jgi:CHAD domain-containing protein
VSALPSAHITSAMLHLRPLIATLRSNLQKCADDPALGPVHDLRTGTRRVQALVEALLREQSDAALQQAADRWLRLLKKLRRAAAPVRDLDVHRKLLHSLLQQPASPALDARIARQAHTLDAWLHHARQHRAARLKKKAARWMKKFDEEAASFLAACNHSAQTRRRPQNTAALVLEAFARLTEQMPHLHAENLHDFRKGAKKCRYLAESAEEDAQAQMTAKALRKLQDEIGKWHDWLVLAEEAQSALDGEGHELQRWLEEQRDRHFLQAMKAVQRLRGKLLGEYLAMAHQKKRASRGPGCPVGEAG